MIWWMFFLQIGGSDSPLVSLQGFSLKLWVNTDDLTCCALHLVGVCTLYEALARGIWKRWSVLEVYFMYCRETHSETGWKRLLHGLEQWQGSTLVVDGQQCNWFFFPASCLALITLVFECFPDIVTCMRHALLCQLEPTIKAPIGSTCRRRTQSKLHWCSWVTLTHIQV